MRSALTCGFTLLLFAGAGLASAQVNEDLDGADTCGAPGLLGLIGQSGEIARLLDLEQPVRVLTPTTAMTMDRRIERINFFLDEDDLIERIECG